MSETTTDTTEARLPGVGAAQAEAGHGRHRGGAAPTEEPAAPAHGRHRRPAEATAGEHAA
ncbi:hypothetical protein [Streptomyces sp. NPDC006879]|uniref:hypothetical protein n=1 Tax=Streptomyces sp. NPDC006879 TaxID=3364767 RepID=UPI0036750659